MKKVRWFLLIVVLFITFSFGVNARETNYIDINEKGYTSNGIFELRDVSFGIQNDSYAGDYGLTGSLYNNSNEPTKYTVAIYFYDSNYNLILMDFVGGWAYRDINKFSYTVNKGKLGGQNINDIKYYEMVIKYDHDGSDRDPMHNRENLYILYDYIISKYDINMVVNENNSFDITETITAYYNSPKHGIYRKLPLKNYITRLDGTTSTNRAQVTNLTVNNEFTKSRERENLVIKIGSPNKTIIGSHTYIIKYNYNIGKDPMKEYDELYYNLIGTEWENTGIENITFKITMPKNFDASKLGFSAGKKGSTNSDLVKYNVDENVITGSYDGYLSYDDALTVRCELDEGYFIGAGLKLDLENYFPQLISVVFLFLSLIFWYLFGKDEKPVETVEFYPPEGFNSLEVGFLYKGEAENEDVTSLLIYLANKGYIKITETEKKSMFSKVNGFKITKLKEYDGNDLNEGLFLKGLFEGKGNSELSEVTSIDLMFSFYKTTDEILRNINNKKNKNKIFGPAAPFMRIIVIMFIILTYCLITVPPFITYGNRSSFIVAMFFPTVGFSVLFKMVFGKTETIYVNGFPTRSSKGTKLFGLVWGSIFGGVPWIFTVLPCIIFDEVYLIGYIIGVVCIVLMAFINLYLPKRTHYGNEILGRIKGFKNFLETAEKEKLEALVMENPTYFYDILPYTYVLGVSNKWIKKFETMNLAAPNWYSGVNSFDVASFGTFMNSTISSASAFMSSSPSASSGGGGGGGFSGGGSSGGGSAGGGSGGGGGGSW